ncbi:hypothetical protein [Xanthomonas sp. 60]
MIRTHCLVIAACLAVAACTSETPSPAEGKPPSSDNQAAPAPPVEIIEAVSSEKLSITPRSVPACDPGSEVTVSWNYSELPAESKLELYVVGDGSEKLFVASNNVNSAKTGPWARPGTKFVLKAESASQVLAEAVVGGPRCQE